jgi:hypothetical protein
MKHPGGLPDDDSWSKSGGIHWNPADVLGCEEAELMDHLPGVPENLYHKVVSPAFIAHDCDAHAVRSYDFFTEADILKWVEEARAAGNRVYVYACGRFPDHDTERGQLKIAANQIVVRAWVGKSEPPQFVEKVVGSAPDIDPSTFNIKQDVTFRLCIEKLIDFQTAWGKDEAAAAVGAQMLEAWNAHISNDYDDPANRDYRVRPAPVPTARR